MCGCFASERDGVRENPFTMPHRSREGAQEKERAEKEARRDRADDLSTGETQIEENCRCTQTSSGNSFLPTANRFTSNEATTNRVRVSVPGVVLASRAGAEYERDRDELVTRLRELRGELIALAESGVSA
jgi:hypothetical protein